MSDSEPRAGITCRVCGLTSWHPVDVREGYCGNCHTWTDGVVVTADQTSTPNSTGTEAPQ